MQTGMGTGQVMSSQRAAAIAIAIATCSSDGGVAATEAGADNPSRN